MKKEISIFVGRKPQFNELEKYFEKAKEGGGSLVFVTGPQGIGKKELVQRFLDHVETEKKKEKVITAKAIFPSSPLSDAYIPFINLISKVIDKSENKFRKLSLNIIMNVIPGILEGLTYGKFLSEILNIFKERWEVEKSKKDTIVYDENLPLRTFYLEYPKILHEISEKIPLVLFIDALERINQPSFTFLSFYVTKIVDSRILLICAYEPGGEMKDALSNLEIEHNVPNISLAELKKEDVASYIDEKYPNNSFHRSFIDLLYKKTKGNPLFLVQLAEFLEQEKVIVMEDDKWHFYEGLLRDEKIPKKIEELVESRLNSIKNDTDRKIHECASVEKEEFTIDILSELLPLNGVTLDNSELLNRIDEVVKEYNLIREKEESTNVDSYEFIHPIVRCAVYNTLSRRLRRRLHEKASELLEAKCIDDNTIAEYSPKLAHHFVQAGNADKALKYFKKAAEKAEDTGSISDALRFYRNMLCIIEEKGKGTPKEKIHILLKMSEIYRFLGLGEKSLGVLKKCQVINAKIGDRLTEASIQTKRGIMLFYLGKFTESINALKKAKKIYEDEKRPLIEEDPRNYGLCVEWLGINYRNCSNFSESKKLHQKALETARKVKSPRLEAHANANLGAICLWQREYEKTMEYWQEALDISEKEEDLPWFAHYEIDVGYLHFLLGDREEAIRHLENGIEIAEKHFLEEIQARGLMNKGNIQFAEENIGKAKENYKKALKIAENRKAFKLIWRIEHNIGNIHRYNGNICQTDKKAREEYNKAETLYKSSIKFLKDRQSGFTEEEQKKGFLSHRLDPFKSLILLYLNMHKEDEAQKLVDDIGHKLKTFLENRKRGIDVAEEEKREGNRNFINGFYIVTE